MAVELVREVSGLYARYNLDLGAPGRADLSVFLLIPSIADKFLDPVVGYINRVRTRSAQNYLRCLKELGKTLHRASITECPTTEIDWQQLVITVHREVITNPDSDASLESRIKDTLQPINLFFRHLQEEGIIPLSILLPVGANLIRRLTEQSEQQLVGQLVRMPSSNVGPKKLLYDISLAESDAEYLDKVEDQLIQRVSALREGLLSYWNAIKSHAEWGRNAIAGIDIIELENRLSTIGYSDRPDGKFGRRSKHYCDPENEEGLARALAIAKKIGGEAPITHDRWMNTPGLPRVFKSNSRRLCLPNGVTTIPGIIRKENGVRLRWFLGVLTTGDIGVLAALIALEHPSFTPEAITQARLVDKHGKRYLQIGDQEHEFTVVKHRALSTKKDGLSNVTYEIITFLSGCVPDLRKKWRHEGNPAADALFISFNPHTQSFGPPNHGSAVSFLSGGGIYGMGQTDWFGSFVPSVVRAGLDRGTISLKKIRNTQGVLDWFRSGSLKSMSIRLGNKERTAIEHYLPKQLLLAWNTRLIRRFQNLWLTVAASDEQYLLEVTDFTTVDELQRFITSMLEQHGATSSPLAMELHTRFATNVISEGDLGYVSDKSTLAINLSKNSLAAVYLLVDSAFNAKCSSSVLDRINPESGVSLRALGSNRGG